MPPSQPSAASHPSQVPASVIARLQRTMHESVARFTPVSGGDVHRCYRVWLGDDRSFFLKTSQTSLPQLFSAEAEGLRWLAGFGALRTPEVLAVADHGPDGPGFLALAWIPDTAPNDEALTRLGVGLAALHCHGQPGPGWHRASAIGPLPQLNGGEALSWAEFWAERRLREMLTYAAPALPTAVIRQIEDVADRCADLLGTGRPLTPLHGDLWRGNVLFRGGEPVLIDPAPYVGDPEVDLAMMALFGGFGAAFWRAYHGELAEDPGQQRRRAVYQLWPLLVHVKLFGGQYVAQTAATAAIALS